MRKTVLLLGLAVLGVGLVAVTSQYKASQILFTDGATLQAKHDAYGLGIYTIDVDGDGTFDCQDLDGDNLCERARVWDADGDGDGGIADCTAQDAPFPQCWYAGQRVRPDFMDDINCMLLNTDGTKRCSATYAMERDGLVVLEPGVMNVTFACWDVGAWTADASTPAGTPAAGINDPRDPTRRDQATDTTVLADCPKGDADIELASIAWAGNSVTMTCDNAGTPVRELRRPSEITAADGLRGCIIATDMGRKSDPWFGDAGGRLISADHGVFSSNAVCGVSHSDSSECKSGFANGGAAANNPDLGGDGWGSITEILPSATHDAEGISICVCNDEQGTNCGTELSGAAGIASEDGWAADLGPNKIVLVDVDQTDSASDTRNQIFRARIDTNTIAQGGCANTGSVELKLGGVTSLDGSTANGLTLAGGNASTGIPFSLGTIACDDGNSQCAVFAVNPILMGNNGLRMENITLMPVDYADHDRGDCTISDYSLIPYAIAGVNADPADTDCDTNGWANFRQIGTHWLKNVTINGNGSDHALDGSGTPPEMRFEELYYVNGLGGTTMDPGTGWSVRGMRVYDSMFDGTVFSAIGVNVDWNDLYVENTSANRLMAFSWQRGVRVRNVRSVNNRFAQEAVNIGCGTQNGIFENFEFISGNGKYASTKSAMSVDCGTSTSLADVVRGNIFTNWIQWDPNGVSYWLVRFANNTVPAAVYGNTFYNFKNMVDSGTPCVFVTGESSCAASPCETEAFETNTFIGGYSTGSLVFGNRSGASCQALNGAIGSSIVPNAQGFVTGTGAQYDPNVFTASAAPTCTAASPTASQIQPGEYVIITDDATANGCANTGTDPWTLSGAGSARSYCQCTSTGWAGF